MIKKLVLVAMLVAPVAAFSATYSVTEGGENAVDAKLISLGQTACVYANVPVALGDILTYPDGSRQVCASGKNGPEFLSLLPNERASH